MDNKLKQLREAWNKLEELVVVNKDTDLSDAWFIAYKDKIVLYNKKNSPLSDEAEKLRDYWEKETNGKFFDAVDDYGEFNDNAEWASDEGYNFIVGGIDGKTITVWGIFDRHEDIRYSVPLQKIARAVGADTIQVESSEGDLDVAMVGPKKETGSMPDVVYHGTNLKPLPLILSRGIRPPKKREQGNWGKLNFNPNHVFVTTKPEKANFHANQASGFSEESPGIIFKLRVPDKKLLGADWDQDREHGGGSWFNDLHKLSKRDRAKLQKQSMALSRNKGILSYAGNIPASHIEMIMGAVHDPDGEYGVPGEDGYTRFDKSSVIENLKKVLDYWEEYELWENGFEWLMDDYSVQEFLDDMGEEDDED